MILKRQWLQEKRTMEFDMVNNINDMMDLYNRIRQNPVQVLSQRFNLPQNISSSQDIIQHLLNTGQVSQDQVNRAMQMQNNPMIRKLFGIK